MADRKDGKPAPGEPEGDWSTGWRPRGWDWLDELVRFGGGAVREQLEKAAELAKAEHDVSGAVGRLAYVLAPGDLQRARFLMKAYPKMPFLKALERIDDLALIADARRIIDGRGCPPSTAAPRVGRPASKRRSL